MMVIFCTVCGEKMEYDEGEGNTADGYSCFSCLNDKDDPTGELQEEFCN